MNINSLFYKRYQLNIRYKDIKKIVVLLQDMFRDEYNVDLQVRKDKTFDRGRSNCEKKYCMGWYWEHYYKASF